jgi:predicted nucleic-acid-binding protein
MTTITTLDLSIQEKTNLLVESYLEDTMIFNPLWDDLISSEIDEIIETLWSYAHTSNSQSMKAVYNTVIDLLREHQVAIEIAECDPEAYEDFSGATEGPR